MNNKNIFKNSKKYTVKEFCKKYNTSSIEEKELLVEEIMNSHYVSYEMKIAICEKIIENSYYRKSEGEKTKKIHINSPAKYMLYRLYLVKQYTNIEIDFSKTLEEFNLLNEYCLFDVILQRIAHKEIEEFNMILDMVKNDVINNEYETHAFFSNQIERFGELFGHIAKPAIDRFVDVLENMDEKTIDKMVGKIKGLNVAKNKFNIIK